MNGIDELVIRYRKETDEKLYTIFLNLKDYSDEAKEALNIVLEERGGAEKIKLEIEYEQDKRFEKLKLEKEIAMLNKRGMEENEICLTLTPILLSQKELKETVSIKVEELDMEAADKAIQPKTIFGGVLGAFFGGTIGGILWGLHMMYSNRIFLFFIFGLVVLSYSFIKLMTKQSKKNIIVVILIVFSVLYALLVGEVLFSIFGYIGQ